ncbi:MAG: hypothetical protein NPINA01_21810 [Nitrospinaceae bacterium]|nr:MAG: hypothetical protein NPINA01_21810 [Nitrospinaceae bacterium]
MEWRFSPNSLSGKEGAKEGPKYLKLTGVSSVFINKPGIWKPDLAKKANCTIRWVFLKLKNDPEEVYGAGILSP